MSSGPNNSSCRVPVYAGPCHLRTLNQVDGVYLRYISSLTCNYPIRRGGHLAAGSQRGPCVGTAKPRVRLPAVQPRHRAADEHPLDLRRALEDREDIRISGSFRRSAACWTP